MTLADLWTALALMAVIEGVLYALFPEAMRRIMASVLAQPVDVMRLTGLMVAALGVGSLWMLRG